jgi:hypothetical protein
MTTTISVVILSLLQRARAKDVTFSLLALSQRHRRPVQIPPPTNSTRGGDWQRMRQW